MEKSKKIRFSLSLILRICLGVLAVLSVGVFANGVMKYNKLGVEKKELEKRLEQYETLLSDLEKEAGSAEQLGQILTCYKEYKNLNSAGIKDLESALRCESLLRELDELLKDQKTREYIIKTAREAGMAFPDEILYFTDVTP